MIAELFDENKAEAERVCAAQIEDAIELHHADESHDVKRELYMCVAITQLICAVEKLSIQQFDGNGELTEIKDSLARLEAK